MNEDEAHRLLTPAACRAARALLNWKSADLMREAQVGPNTIVKLEAGKGVRASTALKIVEAFGRYGVEITNGDGTGARLKSR